MASSIWSSIGGLLFPPSCVLCGRDLAQDWLFDSLCEDCFFAIPHEQGMLYKQGALDRCIWYSSYDHVALRTLITLYKYAGIAGLAKPLGEMQSRALEDARIENIIRQKPVVTFVPLHPLKERFRGYNQSRLLADYIGSYFSLPVRPLVKRALLTPPQASLRDASVRKKNSEDVYVLEAQDMPSAVIIVDDVYTSGATLREIATLFKREHAKIVWGITLAGPRL